MVCIPFPSALTFCDDWGGGCMSETVFTKVDYDLGALIKFIGLGEIGLPDIQRPFVWKNAKVRDLFDSMYKGYPVGYLLFWQNGLAADTRTIGADTKQKPPRLVAITLDRYSHVLPGMSDQTAAAMESALS